MDINDCIEKEKFSLEGGTTAAHLQAILICFCAFIMFFFANLLRGRAISFRALKVIQDGGNQGKFLHLSGRSHLAVQKFRESQFTKIL